MERLSSSRMFDGQVEYYQHPSRECALPMKFGVYLPPQASTGAVPAMLWLSGLTCNETNFLVKAGAQKVAADLGMALIVPDTSPRDTGFDGEDDSYDFGSGAAFYVDATEQPWSQHYRMYSYCSHELIDVVCDNLPIDRQRLGISGHSMGGHGALVLGLRNPEIFRSISAFAPICAPSQCPWGEKALSGYLGQDKQQWAEYDGVELVKKLKPEHSLLVDQGENDEFLAEQLKPELLEKACRSVGTPLNLRRHLGYDHSYNFVATFIADHLKYHHEQLLHS